MNLAAIVVLNGRRCPTTVFFEVAFRIIYSIYARSFWTLSHVGKKSLKGFPSWIISYSFSGVVAVVIIFGSTTPFHGKPRFVGSAFRKTMSAASLARQFIHQAATRFRTSLLEGITFDALKCPAITFTPIDRPMALIKSSKFFHFPTPEALTNKGLHSNLQDGLMMKEGV